MPDQFRIAGRPLVDTQQSNSPAPGVFARPTSIGPLAGGEDNRLQGLIEGLQSFNPALKEWGQRQQQEQEQTAIDQGRAQAETVEAPRDALTGAPVEVPSVVAPAYGPQFRRAYGSALAQRAALDTRQQLSSEYEQQKNAPDFNVDAFLKGWRDKSLQGIQDPLLKGSIGAHLDEVEAGIRHDFTGIVMKRVDESRMSTAFQLGDGFTGDQSPQELGRKHIDWYVPELSGLQVDKKQAASLFFAKLEALSDAGGGRPELFDAFKEKDSEGMSILARNPQLQGNIEEARRRATNERDRKLHEATEGARFAELAALREDVQERPETVTLNRLQTAVGPNGLSAQEAASLYSAAQLSVAKQAIATDVDTHAQQGQLGVFSKEVQSKYLNERFGSAGQKLWDAALGGKPQEVAALGYQLAQAQSRMGATEPVETLQRLIKTNVSTLPNPAGPSATFKAAAVLYSTWSANQQYRDMYFDEKTSKLMDAYLKHQEGNDEKTAYDAAYRAIDPEVIAAANERARRPEVQAKIAAVAMKAAEGSSFLPRWLGGNGRPENDHYIGIWASGVARQALTDNPDLADKEVQEIVERSAARNWALDTTSNLAVKVPPGVGGSVQQAIVDFSTAMGDVLRAKGSFPEGSVIKYIDLDGKGTYRVQAWNGTRHADLDTVTLQQMVTRSMTARTMDRKEGEQAWEYKHALATGATLPTIDPAILGKAVSSGFITDGELQQLQARNGQRIIDRLQQAPGMGFGQPTGNYTEVPKRGNAVVDNKLTSAVALDLFNGAGLTGGAISSTPDNTLGLTASLTAMREGIALRAYQDPARGAGMNIGAGYNLKAHADTVDADLKRAGVPPESVQAVKAGSLQLTTAQTTRLLQVSLAKYAAETEKTANEAAPGLWERMMPAQRAVMIDLAYQTGNAAQFKNAWGALQKGDSETFAKEARAYFTNKAGERVEDTRGTDLRASMLAGASHWKARIGMAAGRPSNPIQSAAQVAAMSQAGGQ